MRSIRFYGLAVGLILAGAALLFLASQQTARILINGVPVRFQTRAFDLEGVLRDGNIALGPGDRLFAPVEERFWSVPQLRVERAAQIQILDGEKAETLLSAERRPANLLAEAGVRLYPGDRVWVDGALVDPALPLASESQRVIQVARAVPVTVDEDGQVRTFHSSAATLGAALWEAGIRLAPADRLDPPAETPLAAPIEARLLRARAVTIRVQDHAIQAHTAAQTVGEVLAEVGLSIQGLDYTRPAEDQAIPANREIRVVRVRESVLMTQKLVPFKTESKLDPETELDHESVIQEGLPGLILNRERVRYEDGQEVSHVAEGEWSAREPQTRILGHGTKVVVRTEVVDGQEIEYWRKISAYATSYSPCRSGVDRCLNGTASGMPVAQGTVATTVSWYLDMLGQQIYVPGYGKATIGDTGGGIPGRYWIDLAYTDDAYVSWHHWVTVYFLTPVPAYIPYILYP